MLGEVPENEEETEEPESSTWEKAWVQLGLSLGGEVGFTGIGRGQITELAHPGTFFEPPSFFILLSISSLCPLANGPFRLPDLLCFFVLGAAPLMSDQLPVAGGRASATRGGVPGGQRPSKDRVCSGQVEGQEPL